MKRYGMWQAGMLAVGLFSTAALACAAGGAEDKHPLLLQGDRVLIGTVEEIRSEQAKINTGEVEPGSFRWGSGRQRDCRI